MDNYQDQFEERYTQNVLREDENAIFIDYTPEGGFQKLISINNLPFAERLTYTSHLSELLPIIGIKITPNLSQIINSLDTDLVKKALLSQLPSIITFLRSFEDGYDLIKDITIHPIFDMLSDTSLDIKEESGNRLCEAAYLLTEDDQRNIILTKILEMAHDEKSDENRIVSVQLLSRMAPIFGKDLCQQFIGFEFLSLGQDPEIRVQMEVVKHLPQISKTVSQEFYQKRLLTFYQEKCADPQWHIRKAAVDIIVELSELSDGKVRETELTTILTKFLEDTNKWIKVSAYKQLGPFIGTLLNLQKSEKLFQHFLQMTDPAINMMGNDNEILVACSYNFPCVLNIYGKNKWKELFAVMIKLINNKNKKVKKPIACAIHEIARMIGPQAAEENLFNIYQQILDDQSDNIRHGVIKNLCSFLKVFDKERRENLLEVILIVQKDPKKWRIRQIIAQQIENLTEIYSDPDTIFQYILPISIKLCNDIVWSVREEAATRIHAVLNAIYSHELYRDCVIQNINAFSQQTRFSQRQTFLTMCGQLIYYPERFRVYFLENFVNMGNDKVLNVRIQFASVLAQIVIESNELRNDLVIQQMIEKVVNDPVHDVRVQFTNICKKYQVTQYRKDEQAPKRESISQHMKELMEIQNEQQNEDKQIEDKQIETQEMTEIQNNEKISDDDQQYELNSTKSEEKSQSNNQNEEKSNQNQEIQELINFNQDLVENEQQLQEQLDEQERIKETKLPLYNDRQQQNNIEQENVDQQLQQLQINEVKQVEIQQEEQKEIQNEHYTEQQNIENNQQSI